MIVRHVVMVEARLTGGVNIERETEGDFSERDSEISECLARVQ